MKTIIKISHNYDGDCSNFEQNDSVDSLVNFSMKVHCEISNDKMLNIVEEIKKYQTCKEDFKNLSIVKAKGYSQSEWQEYKLYHNQPEGDDDLRLLIEELKKTFTQS